MAELIWKGKPASLIPASSPHIPSPRPLLTQQVYMPESPQGTTSHDSPSTAWQNRLIWGDKTAFLPALLVDFAGTIDLIYIDPPFMTGRTFRRGAEIVYHDTWNNDLDIYLQWLYETLSTLHTLLSPRGSLYIHLDWRTIHYAKIMLDEIFRSGSARSGAGFKNEIIWHYQSGGNTRKYYSRKHDTLLLYTKSGQYCFHGERIARPRGQVRRNHMRKEIAEDGRITWTIRSSGRIYTYDEETPMPITDVWNDISHLHQKDPERTGYSTQKPEALLERIILASSEENDLILDCFCGSGVTAVVAERLNRRWIVGDQNELAISTTRQRLLTHELKRSFVLQQLHEQHSLFTD
ncbi:DNA methyltransferase [Tengunoibacter tsumagoiensis]|uniref:DNA methylase N-4/N-6 domain-containing protein n=1 Tax=Tengunoibacter tsumagoiensis TaxID=2014871 RepID=A0A402A1W1_9CHLR|nr:site-specific DNA-methyltransferase [Tengunoibacter tsumagoiensis]GCE12981.1 hypothetical protein KTT_28400 [Tengunoibacter tsumagoiensis]